MLRTRPPTRRLRPLVLLLLAALVAGPLLSSARPAHAAVVFTVNHVGDAGDLGAFVCDAYHDEGRQCTLRAAIDSANALPGRDTIRFAIPDDPAVPGLELKSIRP